jgi:hypothetical protein
MRFREAWRLTPPLLLLAVAGACARPPAARQPGSVEIPLTGADAAGTPYRLRGELTFSGVDNGVVRSASTRTAGASDVLEVPLPAGRYTLTLNAEFVVESRAPCARAATEERAAWVNPARLPLVDVAEGHVARVRFDLVAADPPPSRAGNESGSARPLPSPRQCSSRAPHTA